MQPLRALIVSYAFPPIGGAGVQRVLKWARYLPDHGVVPTVLTVRNPSAPVRDPSLLAEVAPPATVIRAFTLEPGYRAKALAFQKLATEPAGRAPGGPRAVLLGMREFRAGIFRAPLRVAGSLLFPDPQVLWVPGAAAAMWLRSRRKATARGGAFDVAVISAPPFSQLLLLPIIRALWGIPVVIDYRDEWTTTMEAGHDAAAGRRGARLAAKLEGSLLAQARAITTATAEFGDALLERFPRIDRGRVHFLPNGYDAADLPPPGVPSTDKFVIVYAGTVFGLTSLRSVLNALKRLRTERPDLAEPVELHVYGRVSPSEADAFIGADDLGVKLHGYVDHRAALDALAASHLNLCVLDDVPGAERIYPAKIFELMALGGRCLILAPEGALTRLASRHGFGSVLPPRDDAAIARAVGAMVEAWQRGAYDPRISPPAEIERYERRALAGELANLLLAVSRESSSERERDARTRTRGRGEGPGPSGPSEARETMGASETTEAAEASQASDASYATGAPRSAAAGRAAQVNR